VRWRKQAGPGSASANDHRPANNTATPGHVPPRSGSGGLARLLRHPIQTAARPHRQGQAIAVRGQPGAHRTTFGAYPVSSGVEVAQSGQFRFRSARASDRRRGLGPSTAGHILAAGDQLLLHRGPAGPGVSGGHGRRRIRGRGARLIVGRWCVRVGRPQSAGMVQAEDVGITVGQTASPVHHAGFAGPHQPAKLSTTRADRGLGDCWGEAGDREDQAHQRGLRLGREGPRAR